MAVPPPTSQLTDDLPLLHALQPSGYVHDGGPLADPDEPVVDQGLRFDLATLGRRRALRLLGGSVVGGVLLAACTPGSTDRGGAVGGGDVVADDGCLLIPSESAGPFPADGSNGPDVLAESGAVRRDIRSSFGEASGVADGVPMEVELAIQDASSGCAPLAGAAVYLWQCDAAGDYSLYSPAAAGENYLRGVQAADGDGVVRFTTIVPGTYPGRWPHLHFEVFPDLARAGDADGVVAVSQLALPEASCRAAYDAMPGVYGDSPARLGELSLETDILFRDDGGVHQLATVIGDAAGGFTARLTVPV